MRAEARREAKMPCTVPMSGRSEWSNPTAERRRTRRILEQCLDVPIVRREVEPTELALRIEAEVQAEAERLQDEDAEARRDLRRRLRSRETWHWGQNGDGCRVKFAELPSERPPLKFPRARNHMQSILWRLMVRYPKCWYCSKPVVPAGEQKDRPTLDHLTPRFQGGRGQQGNLVLACYECNQIRGIEPLQFVQVTIKPRRLIIVGDDEEPLDDFAVFGWDDAPAGEPLAVA